MCFSYLIVTSIDPGSIELFAREVKELYLHAKASLENPNANSKDLGTIKIKMEAAVQHLRRLEWALDLTRPCGGDLLELIINQVKQLECKIGEMIETFNGLIPLLADDMRYRAPVPATRSVGRPSFIITKEQLKIMRSYGLSWMDIAKALGM